MAKTVENALQVNILSICKAAQQTQSNVLRLEWVNGSRSQVGIAVVAEDHLAVIKGGKVYRSSIWCREFRPDRFLPHIQCLACAKRCHTLYLDGGMLQCRRCAGLIYECQRGHERERASVKVQKILHQLGGSLGGIPPPRPLGMHRNTYNRKLSQLAHAFDVFSAINRRS